MKTMTLNVLRTGTALAVFAALAACGGGGGGGDNGSASSASPASGASTPATPTNPTNPANVTTPQYASDSFQLAAFNVLNQQRQQCGFPALQENPALDQAAAAHAQYQATNNTISDFETAGAPGFTGTTYSERAAHFGFANAAILGVSGGFYTNATWTEARYGEQAIYGLVSGVYHIAIAVAPTNTVGIGKVATTYNGFPQEWYSLTMANYQQLTTNAPLTFPCQGTTGVAYSAGGEIPTPPGTSGNWGTPVAVAGNLNDTVVMQTGTMTDSASHVITLQVLDSAKDPNKKLPAWMGVAYPATPLSPNSQYTVSLTGTINGTPFSRTFTFTTGNVIG